MQGQRRALGVLVALVLAACSPQSPVDTAITASPGVQSDAPGLATAGPVSTPSPAPTPTADAAASGATDLPSPSPEPWVAITNSLAWHRVGSIPADVARLVGFDAGYVALSGDGLSTYFSRDGRAWRRTKLPLDPPGRGGVSADSNGRVGRSLATNGSEVLLVGGYSHPPCGQTDPGSTGDGPDCDYSPVAWLTTDGRHWTTILPDTGTLEFVAAWPLNGGWEAAASSWSGETLGGRSLWRSPDGLAWARSGPRPPAPWEGYDPDVPVGISDASGMVLLAAAERGDDYTTTLASRDPGGSWQVLDGFPGAGSQVIAGTAPEGTRNRWVLGGLAYDESGCDPDTDGDLCGTMTPTVWSSADGVAWTASALETGTAVPPSEEDELPLAVTAVESLARSGRGYVAVGTEANHWQGARHDTWVSDDGVTWTRLGQADPPTFDYGPGLVADGPAGVIGISATAKESRSAVWELR